MKDLEKRVEQTRKEFLKKSREYKWSKTSYYELCIAQDEYAKASRKLMEYKNEI